jgi:hypothetical protein
MSLQAIVAAVLGCFLSCPLFLNGQVTPSVPGSITSAASAEQHYPEQAYLSPARYTNGFFGFSFELPAAAHLEPIPEPVAPDGRIQLLELGGPPPADAAVSIVAFPPRGQAAPDAKALLRKALDQELFRGVEELRALSKTMLAGHQFYFYETRRGIDQHMLAAANLDGYVVIVELGAHNEKMMKDLELCFQHVVFFAPQQVRQYIAADAQPYEGPAISSHRLAQLNADPPESHIDPGKLEGSVYRNPALGFSYQLPQGWFVEPQGAVLPAIERTRASDSWAALLGGGTPNAGASERQLMKACSRTLFSVWAKRPGADGQIPYDDFGEVTLSAISAECFPGVKFPANSADRQALQDFLLRLELTHPILRDMRDARAFTSHGVVFLLLHGSIAFKEPNDELSRRLSVAMAITQRRGYLLTWFFAAPHDSELEPLLKERAGFDPEPTTQDASATKAGSREAPGKEAAPAAAVSASPAPGSTSQAPTGSASGASPSLPGGGSTVDSPASTTTGGQNGASNSSGTASGGTSQPESDSSSTPPAARPTLLRPGETIESQQGKGAPVHKH